MKKCQFVLAAACVVVLACTLSVPAAYGQAKPQAVHAKATTATPHDMEGDSTRTPFCDEVLPKAMQDLQKSADSKCQTATTCVYCMERASKTALYASLFAQPSTGKCKAAATVGTQLPANEKVAAFQAEIMQAACPKGGVDLEVIFPEAEGRRKAALYDYSWEIDGKQAGNTNKATCACGKTAKVTITERATGRSVMKLIALPACNP